MRNGMYHGDGDKTTTPTSTPATEQVLTSIMIKVEYITKRMEPAASFGADGQIVPAEAPQITLISKNGGPATKKIFLDKDGKLVSDGSACSMKSGEAVRAVAKTADELAQIIGNCKSNHVIALGALKPDLSEPVEIVSKDWLPYNPDAIARARAYIDYRPKVPAWALLDYDTKQMPGEIKQKIDAAAGGVWQVLLSIAPELEFAARVSRASTSAGLYRKDTGEQIAGSNGMHHYVLVSDGGDVERFLKDLHDRCWLHGLGWYMLGKAGQLLERSIVDRMVYGGERLCFEGQAKVKPPLAQDLMKRAPQAIEGRAIDTVAAVAPLSVTETSKVQDLKTKAKQGLKGESVKARKHYIDVRSDELVEKTGMTKSAAVHVVTKQCNGVLLPDCELPFTDEKLAGTTVADVLADPERFVGETLADPIQGVEYGRNRAMIMRANEGGLFIHSFAHGKTFYWLRYDIVAIQKLLEQVADADAIDKFIEFDAQIDIDDIGFENLVRYLKTRTGNSIPAIKRKIKEAREKREEERAQPKTPVVAGGIEMPEWREMQMRVESGGLVPIGSLHNAGLALVALGIECKYDTFHNKMLFGFSNDTTRHALEHVEGEVSDNAVIALRQLMSNTFGFDMTTQHTRDAIVSLALDHCFDPVVDMLAEAEKNWDGVARLDRMAVEYFNAEDTKLNAACMRKTMIGAVTRARHPGCKFDTILVLESEEGYNKSTAWCVLAGDENFGDESIIGKGSREVQEHLADIWIHENAELAGMKKAELEMVKSYASRQKDRARRAYGHFLENQPRHSIDVGTTNNDKYLLSQTGNRRFWPMKVLESIDIEKLKRDRLQLWGEAAHYQSEGESVVLDKALWKAAGVEQEARRVIDPWEEVLRAIPETVMTLEREFSALANVKAVEVRIIHRQVEEDFWVLAVAAPDLLEHVLHIQPGNQQVAHTMRLSTVMKKLGWDRAKNGYVSISGVGRVRGYFRMEMR